MSDFKPTEHEGLTKSGEPDRRVKGNRPGDDDAPSAADNNETERSGSVESGGSGSTGEVYKPTDHDGLKQDGSPDKRVSSEHGFGGRPHEEVVELGRQGGKASH